MVIYILWILIPPPTVLAFRRRIKIWLYPVLREPALVSLQQKLCHLCHQEVAFLVLLWSGQKASRQPISKIRVINHNIENEQIWTKHRYNKEIYAISSETGKTKLYEKTSITPKQKGAPYGPLRRGLMLLCSSKRRRKWRISNWNKHWFNLSHPCLTIDNLLYMHINKIEETMDSFKLYAIILISLLSSVTTDEHDHIVSTGSGNDLLY